MQSITVTGRLGRDPQQHQSSNGGEPFATFTMASNSRIKGVDKTTWYDVLVSLNKRTSGMIQYLKKGSSVIVIGELDVSTYDANDGTRVRLSINCEHIEFNGGDGSGVNKTNNTQQNASESPTDVQAETAPVKTAAKSAKKATSDAPEDIPMTSTKPAKKTAAAPVEPAENDNGGDDDELPF